jgi:hypothetical protein
MQHNIVIFSIDNGENPNTALLFESSFNNHPKRSSNLIHTEGSYEGTPEKSYICNRKDFNEIVVDWGWVNNQHCVLGVTSCNKAYAQLEYINGCFDQSGDIEQIGCMHSVTKEEALSSSAYTYRPDLDLYWIAKTGNPDNSFRDSKARADAGYYS